MNPLPKHDSGEPEELAFDTSMKKKKKKRTEDVERADTLIDTKPSEEGKPVQGEYSYSELVHRFYSILRQNNPDLAGEKRKFTMIPPQVIRESTKKTAFCNVDEISRRLRRPQEHVQQFLLTELGTTGNNDSQARLIIRGRFQQGQIEAILKKYILEYVTCKTCRSAETNMTKDNRLFFVVCESCGSSRSVTAIKTGFTAQTGKRAAARAAGP